MKAPWRWPVVLAVSFALGVTVCRAQQSGQKNTLEATMESAPTHPAPARAKAAPTPAQAASIARDNAYLAHDVAVLCQAGKYDAALAKVNPVIQAAPNNAFAKSLRGYVYCKQHKWDLANADFESILQVNPQATEARFDLAEVKFLQKDYPGARHGFAALTSNPDLTDLASYKVFLCDLYGGDQAKAKAELDVFNASGENPSYYFGNIAWDLYHKRTDDARTWLDSAVHIYFPAKLESYARSLFDLGYLPIAGDGPEPYFKPAP